MSLTSAVGKRAIKETIVVLNEYASRNQDSFLVNDRQIAKKLGLELHHRSLITKILRKMPNSEVWCVLERKTVFRMDSSSVIKVYDKFKEQNLISQEPIVS